MTPKNFNFQKTFYRKNYSYFNDWKNAPNFFGCWKVKYLWAILCLYFWGPEAMIGNNFKKKKVVPLIFTQFWISSHLNKLNWLTHRMSNMQVATYICRFTVLFPHTIQLEQFFIKKSCLNCRFTVRFPNSIRATLYQVISSSF